MEGTLRRWEINKEDGTGVPTISLVDDPAIEQPFLKFSKDQNRNFNFDGLSKEELNNVVADFILLDQLGEVKQGNTPDNVRAVYQGKRVITGLAMVPWKPIFRIDAETGEDYYGFFTPDDIFNSMLYFAEEGLTNRFNEDHSETEFLQDAFLVESEYVVDPKKSKAAAFGWTVPFGSWWVTLAVSDETWNRFGEDAGFSVEAFLTEAIFTSFQNKSN